MLASGITSDTSHKSDIHDDKLTRELQIAKFKKFAKDNFQLAYPPTADEDYLNYIKRGSQLPGLQLPLDKSEIFIQYENVPLYFISDVPAIIKSEEWLKSDAKSKNIQLEDYRTIKDFFIKWAILRTEQEKRYFSFSAIKLIEKDSYKNNFLREILHAVILTYDKKLFAPAKALELYQGSEEIIKQCNMEEIFKNELIYIIKILTGFLYLKQFAFDKAHQLFTEAIQLKSYGITAKYYLALTEKKLGNKQIAALILSEIIEYDKSLFQVAIQNNNLSFLNYAFRNAVTYHIFREFEFADMLDYIEKIITSGIGNETITLDKLTFVLTKLNELKLKDYYSEEVIASIEFLEKVNQTLSGNKNTFVSLSNIYLKGKFDLITDQLIKSIENRSREQIFEKLKPYDDGINDNLEAIKHLSIELEELKKKSRKKLDESLQVLDKNIREAISATENRIENLQNEKKFNPRSTFNSLMVYNLIITLLVFIVGGFSGCYQGSIDNVYDFRDVMTTVILSGLKWSAVIFLIGIIIAFLAAGFAIVEKMNEKQHLIRRIEFLRSQLDRESNILRKENDKKMSGLSENFDERIEEHKKNIEALKKEKETTFIALQEEAKNKLEAEVRKIREATCSKTE